MCAIVINNQDAESIIFCTFSVSGYLTNEVLDYRNEGRSAGLLNNKWRVAKAEAAFLGLFVVSLVEGVFRILIGIIAACFAKANTDLIKSVAWSGSGTCFDAALRNLIALVRNFTLERMTYEDLMLYPFVGAQNAGPQSQVSNDADAVDLLEPEEVESENTEAEASELAKAVADAQHDFITKQNEVSKKLEKVIPTLHAADVDTQTLTRDVLDAYLAGMTNYFNMRIEQIQVGSYSPLELQAVYRRYVAIVKLAGEHKLLTPDQRDEHNGLAHKLNQVTLDSSIQYPWKTVTAVHLDLTQKSDDEEEEFDLELFESEMSRGLEMMRNCQTEEERDQFISEYLRLASGYLKGNGDDAAFRIFEHYDGFYFHVRHRISQQERADHDFLADKFNNQV